MRKLIVMLLVLFLLTSVSFVAFAGEGILVSPNITATAVGPHQVDVSWEPAPGETTGYEVIRSKTDNPDLLTALGTVSANVYSYTDTSVSPSTSYYYAVTPIYLQSQSRGMDYQKALVTTPSNSSSLSSSYSTSTTLTSESTEQASATTNQTVIPKNQQDTSKVTTLKIGNPEMTVQGKTTVLDVAPKIENGRTLVPLRAISEALGAEVTWDEQTQTVTVISRQGN